MIQKWIEKLGDSDLSVRIYAASVLSSLIDTPEARNALKREIPELTKALKCPDKNVRLNTLVALSEMGESAKEAVPRIDRGVNRFRQGRLHLCSKIIEKHRQNRQKKQSLPLSIY